MAQRSDPPARGRGEWLDAQGPDSDVVVSSRVRFARNLAGYPFVARATPDQRVEIVEVVRKRLADAPLPERVHFVDLTKAEPIEGRWLLERHLISRELANDTGPRGVAFSPSETLSVMVNEEDHLRLQAMRSGYVLEEVRGLADRLDDEVEATLPYAFARGLGFLTACPTNVGTGMRASVMLHLPALVYSKHIERVFQSVTKINLAVRGFYGEGTTASGDFYQISNQVTLGVSESDILETLGRIVPRIVQYEREVRDYIQKERRGRVEDRVWRAIGVMKGARSMATEEAMEHLSALRLGVCMGLVNGISVADVNTLFIDVQPAHLQKRSGGALESEERDVLRADHVREALRPVAL